MNRLLPLALLLVLLPTAAGVHAADDGVTVINGCRLEAESHCAGADLRGADLRHLDLRRIDLSGADLSGADLRHANLDLANLEKARLARADLTRASLQQANLRLADFPAPGWRRSTAGPCMPRPHASPAPT